MAWRKGNPCNHHQQEQSPEAPKKDLSLWSSWRRTLLHAEDFRRTAVEKKRELIIFPPFVMRPLLTLNSSFAIPIHLHPIHIQFSYRCWCWSIEFFLSLTTLLLPLFSDHHFPVLFDLHFLSSFHLSPSSPSFLLQHVNEEQENQSRKGSGEENMRVLPPLLLSVPPLPDFTSSLDDLLTPFPILLSDLFFPSSHLSLQSICKILFFCSFSIKLTNSFFPSFSIFINTPTLASLFCIFH